MTQEKMIKIAKGLDIAAVVIKIVTIIGMVAMALVIATIFITEPEAIESGAVTNQIKFNNLSITFISEDLPTAEMTKTNLLFAGIFAFLGLFATLYGVKFARRTLAPMKEGRPFDPVCSENIKKLAILVFAVGFIAQIASLIYSAYFFEAYNLNGLYGLAGSGASVEKNYTFDLTFAVISGVLWLFFYVFKYGEVLQKDSDETL